MIADGGWGGRYNSPPSQRAPRFAAHPPMMPVPLFWLAALAIVAVTLAALLWPLLRRRATDDAPEALAATTSIYRDQKRQLDADLAAGAITAQEHAAAQDELASRLGAEIVPRHPEHRDGPASTRGPWVAALVLVAIVPAAAVLAYFVLGNPAAMTPQTLAASSGSLTPLPSLRSRFRPSPCSPADRSRDGSAP